MSRLLLLLLLLRMVVGVVVMRGRPELGLRSSQLVVRRGVGILRCLLLLQWVVSHLLRISIIVVVVVVVVGWVLRRWRHGEGVATLGWSQACRAILLPKASLLSWVLHLWLLLLLILLVLLRGQLLLLDRSEYR